MLDILAGRIALIQESLGKWATDIATLAVEFNSFKLKVILADGSTLRVEEHYTRGKLGRYAYYLLDPSNNLIVGWDNAPHHSRLANFPHHKHLGQPGTREPSYETTLEDVLAIIKQKFAATA